jgi:hypothetical protein
MDDMSGDLARFNDLIDLYGPDLDVWPQAGDATWARRLILANRQARALQLEAADRSCSLAVYGAAMDALVTPEVSARVAASVMARLPKQVSEVSWWVPRIAAGFLLAVVAGGVFDVYVQGAQNEDAVELASLGTLVYGPAELDIP